MLRSARNCHGDDMPTNAALKVLVVDDHAALRQTVRQMFEGLDADFLEAATGEEAVRLFAAERPDWVVMDLRMPGMGGLKATEAIRLLDAHARVIVISQFVEAEYSDQVRRAGAIEFVNKENLFRLPLIVQANHLPQRPPLQP